MFKMDNGNSLQKSYIIDDYYTLTTNNTSDPDYMGTFCYRGYTIRIFLDAQNRQLYTMDWPIFNGPERLEFGLRDFCNYEGILKNLIDKKLDNIYAWPEDSEYYGLKLERFQNGDFYDIRLVYKRRILSVTLSNPNKRNLISLDDLIKKSEKLFKKLCTNEPECVIINTVADESNK